MRKTLSAVVLGVVATMAIWMMTFRAAPHTIIPDAGPQSVPPLEPDRTLMIVLAASVIAAAAGFAAARYREMSRRSDQRNHGYAGTDDRLDRIEQTLDAVALEVERIGEMERFATKLLAQRQVEMEPRVSASPPRVITPH